MGLIHVQDVVRLARQLGKRAFSIRKWELEEIMKITVFYVMGKVTTPYCVDIMAEGSQGVDRLVFCSSGPGVLVELDIGHEENSHASSL
jgi:hypothetical protein